MSAAAKSRERFLIAASASIEVIVRSMSATAASELATDPRPRR
jgi:hypothetical protein